MNLLTKSIGRFSMRNPIQHNNIWQIILWGIVLILFPFIVQAGTFFDNFAAWDIEKWETDKVLLERKAIKVWQGHLLLSQSWANDPPFSTWIQVNPKLQPDIWKNYTLRFRLQFTQLYFHAKPKLRIYTLLQLFRDANLGNAPINFHVAYIYPRINLIFWSNLRGDDHGSQLVNIKEKVWYSVKIIHNDGQYEFWWDDKRIKQYRDDAWLGGGIGFYVRACDILLDNIQISGENVPDFQPRAVELGAKKIATTWGTLKRLK